MTVFTCKECGAPVRLEGDKPVRSCKCEGGILASLKATATGKGSMK